MSEQNIKADGVQVANLTDFLLQECLEPWLQKHPEMTLVDIFMGIHNFHWMMVKTIARSWEPGVPSHRTYRMADMTFRDAMKRLKRES